MKNKPYVNQVLKLPVDRLGTEGDLIFVHNNFIIIVKERVKFEVNQFLKIRITKVLNNFALAVFA